MQTNMVTDKFTIMIHVSDFTHEVFDTNLSKNDIEQIRKSGQLRGKRYKILPQLR